MTINEYKTALKNIIDSTDDEELLKHWKTHLEWEFEQYQQRTSQQDTSPTESTPIGNTGKDDAAGYAILESGLGIDE
jgi:hypothetical protein